MTGAVSSPKLAQTEIARPFATTERRRIVHSPDPSAISIFSLIYTYHRAGPNALRHREDLRSSV